VNYFIEIGINYFIWLGNCGTYDNAACCFTALPSLLFLEDLQKYSHGVKGFTPFYVFIFKTKGKIKNKSLIEILVPIF